MLASHASSQVALASLPHEHITVLYFALPTIMPTRQSLPLPSQIHLASDVGSELRSLSSSRSEPVSMESPFTSPSTPATAETHHATLASANEVPPAADQAWNKIVKKAMITDILAAVHMPLKKQTMETISKKVLDDVRHEVDAQREKISKLVRHWTTTMNKRSMEEETPRKDLVDDHRWALQQVLQKGQIEIMAAIPKTTNALLLCAMDTADITRRALIVAVAQARVGQQKYEALVRGFSRWTDTCVGWTAAERHKADAAVHSLQERAWSEVEKRLTPLLKGAETKSAKLQEVTERSEVEAKGTRGAVRREPRKVGQKPPRCHRRVHTRGRTPSRHGREAAPRDRSRDRMQVRSGGQGLDDRSARERTAAIDAIALHARSATSIAPQDSAPASTSASAVRSSGAREDQDDLKEIMDVLKRAVCALEKGSAGLTALLAAGSNTSGPTATAAFDRFDPAESACRAELERPLEAFDLSGDIHTESVPRSTACNTASSESSAESAVLPPEENSSSTSSRPLSPASTTLSDMELELAMLRAWAGRGMSDQHTAS